MSGYSGPSWTEWVLKILLKIMLDMFLNYEIIFSQMKNAEYEMAALAGTPRCDVQNPSFSFTLAELHQCVYAFLNPRFVASVLWPLPPSNGFLRKKIFTNEPIFGKNRISHNCL
jgi:hypothetical protein